MTYKTIIKKEDSLAYVDLESYLKRCKKKSLYFASSITTCLSLLFSFKEYIYYFRRSNQLVDSMDTNDIIQAVVDKNVLTLKSCFLALSIIFALLFVVSLFLYLKDERIERVKASEDIYNKTVNSYN